MTTVARPGPTPTGGGPGPTLEQLFILVARAERKGGLDYAEGDRLRAGLQHFAGRHLCDSRGGLDGDELRRKYENARKKAWRWKRDATKARAGGSPVAAVDEEARDALRRVVELATRWTHIPAKRQAGVSVLATIRNDDHT